MAIKNGARKMKVTVGDLIAAVFDVVGDQVDQAIDLLRFEDMQKRSQIILEGAISPPRKGCN